MPTYAYEALNRTGEVVSGRVEAPNPARAQQALEAQGLTPLEVRPERSARRGLLPARRVSPYELALFSRQLATLLRAGVPTGNALEALTAQATHPRLRAALEEVRREVFAGARLHRALAQHPQVFPEVYTNLVHAGEESGSLDKTLLRLAEHLERTSRLRARLRSAMIQPSLILLAALGITYGMVAYVVPQFVTILKQFDTPLPLLTRVLMFVGTLLKDYTLFLLLGVAGAVFGAAAYSRTPTGRRVLARFLLRLPLLGPLMQKQILASLAATLTTLYASGVPLPNGVEITRKTLGNPLYEDALGAALERLTRGQPLSKALEERPDLFPPLFLSIVRTGEESGSLEQLLGEYAAFTEDEIEQGAAGLTSALQPVITAVLAVVVTVIMLAVLLPYFDVIQNIQNLRR